MHPNEDYLLAIFDLKPYCLALLQLCLKIVLLT